MGASLQSGGICTSVVSGGRVSSSFEGPPPPSPEHMASAGCCRVGHSHTADRPDPRLASGRVCSVGMCGDRLPRAEAEPWLGGTRPALVKPSVVGPPRKSVNSAASVRSSSMKLSTSQLVAISASATTSTAFAASGAVLIQALESASHGDIGSRGEPGCGVCGADHAHSSSLSSAAMLKILLTGPALGPHASSFASGVEAGSAFSSGSTFASASASALSATADAAAGVAAGSIPASPSVAVAAADSVLHLATLASELLRPLLVSARGTVAAPVHVALLATAASASAGAASSLRSVARWLSKPTTPKAVAQRASAEGALFRGSADGSGCKPL